MTTAEFIIGHSADDAAERKKEARKILWALLAALGIHLLIGYSLAVFGGLLYSPFSAIEEDKPVELTFVVITLSLVCGLLVALAGMSRLAPLRWLVKAYIEVIRGTPLLLQLIYVYYVLPEIGIRLDAFTAGVLALTLNYSAYISEVYRSGIQAIAKGQPNHCDQDKSSQQPQVCVTEGGGQ